MDMADLLGLLTPRHLRLIRQPPVDGLLCSCLLVGRLVACSLCAFGVPVICVCCACGRLVVCLWYACGMLVVCLWYACGMLVVFSGRALWFSGRCCGLVDAVVV